MSDHSFLRDDRIRISVQFISDKIHYLLRSFPRQSNSIIITGTDYWKGYFEYALKNTSDAKNIKSWEKKEKEESFVESLKKLEKPYILISDRFYFRVPGDLEYLVYFISPLRIQGMISDINRISNRKGLKVEILCDWREYEDFYPGPGEAGFNDAVDMREWLSRSRCRIAMIDEIYRGSGEDCGLCDFCLSRGAGELEDTEARVLALLKMFNKAVNRGRLFELGYGTHRHDVAVPGHGALQGIRRDDALRALFSLKNRGLIEFSGRGTEMFIKGI